MALMVEVTPVLDEPDSVRISSRWEDETSRWRETVIPREKNMTAAESVEWFLLSEFNLVGSWFWGSARRGEHRVLFGQFVSGEPDGRKSYKEVAYTLAHEFDC